MRMWLISAGLVLAAIVFVGGCSPALETGYTPRPLGASATDRRGYYAAPYTPESTGGQQSPGEEARTRRPTRY